MLHTHFSTVVVSSSISQAFIMRHAVMTLKIKTRKVLSTLILDKCYQPVRLKFLICKLPIHLCMSGTINVKRRGSPVGLTLVREIKSVLVLAF